MGPFGWKEILIVLFIVVLLFGAKKLPELARGMGKSIKEFKKATNEADADDDEDKAEPTTAAAASSSGSASTAKKKDVASNN